MQRPDPTAEIGAVLDDFRRIVRALRLSSSAARQRLGVTGAQLFVLKALAGGPRTMSDVALRTRTHQSTVSVVVKRLVARDLVRRAPSAADGRAVELTLSPSGRALLRHAPDAAQESLIEGLERLADGERRVLARALHRLVEAMELHDETPAMFFEYDRPRRTRPRA
jgi:DNA-binding MarR family transcriptional regulator